MKEYSITKGHSIKDYNVQYPTAGGQHHGTLDHYRNYTSTICYYENTHITQLLANDSRLLSNKNISTGNYKNICQVFMVAKQWPVA